MGRRQISLCKFDFIESSTAFEDICDDDIFSALCSGKKFVIIKLLPLSLKNKEMNSYCGSHSDTSTVVFSQSSLQRKVALYCKI
jgi:hypothetical protein